MKIDEAYQLALSQFQAGRYRDADGTLRKILNVRPDHSDAIHLVGLFWHHGGDSPNAAAFIRRAILINPLVPDYHHNLGLILAGQGATDAAIEAIQKAIALRANFSRAHHNLGMIYADLRRWDEAIESFQRALTLEPELADAELNLARAMQETGEMDAAIAGYRRASQLGRDPRSASGLLCLLPSVPDCPSFEIARAFAEWNRVFAAPLQAQIRPHSNDATPDRTLRVGYVSADFRESSIGRSIAPLLEHHDQERFDVYCYSDVQWPDEMTQRLQSCAAVWRDTAGMSDEKLAELICADAIDVLIDLGKHGPANRLLAFARKPAPVQATYLGCGRTTGLPTIDYRFSDSYLDPPSTTRDRMVNDNQTSYLEQTIQLRSYVCYEPPDDAPELGALPELTAGFITFGCLSAFSKLTKPTLNAWASILSKVPHSRIIIRADDGAHRDRMAAGFVQHGINAARIDFTPKLPFADYLRQHDKIDVVLDPFPCSGAMTACDALWTGVPVVSLAGPSGVGASILSTIGLPRLIAESVDEYIELALRLATDRDRRLDLRRSLRTRVQSSALLDAPAFTRDFELTIRDCWKVWCTGQGEPRGR